MELSLEYSKGEFLLVAETPQFKTPYERIMQVIEGNINAMTNAKEGEVYVICKNYKQYPVAFPERGIEKKLGNWDGAIKHIDEQAATDFRDNQNPNPELMEIAEKVIDWVRGNQKP